MKVANLNIEVGDRFSLNELREVFDRGSTNRGIEVCYDEDDQKYVRLFSSETGPYNDNVRSGQFTYIGEGRTGDQELKGGNRVLAQSIEAPIPIYFFYKESTNTEWEYQGQAAVLDYERRLVPSEDREVYQFTLQRRTEGRERVDGDEQAVDLTRPERIESTRSRIVRNTQVSKSLKRRYSNTCQICGNRREQGNGQGYSEAHHLKPLGRPHDGPDTESNVIVLCPNHHADFDYGTISVAPTTLVIKHEHEQFVDGARLTIREDHELAEKFLQYHEEHIAVDSVNHQ
jgi:5-methylcytosine-specific restriction endonuclease McrA